MWLSIKKKGIDGFREDARQCIEKAQYIYKRFKDAGLEAMLNDYSNTLVFPRPTDNDLIQVRKSSLCMMRMCFFDMKLRNGNLRAR